MEAFSFFSNAGIGDMGVEKAGVKVVVANELLLPRANTYAHNHKHTKVIQGDVNNLNNEDLLELKKQYTTEEELFLLVATPPCQGVSNAGKRNPHDIRNQLIKPTVNAIKVLNPKWAWIENVPGYGKATIPNLNEVVADDDTYERIQIMDYIRNELEPLGYRMVSEVLDAKDYGVPQTRKRLIIILTRTDKELSMPTKTHGEGLLAYKTTRDAIGKLEPLESGEKSKKDVYHIASKHSDRHIKWMKATPEGKSAHENEKFEDRPHIIDKKTGELRRIKGFGTTYKRIWWDKPAPTVTMSSGSISSQNNVHPRDSRAMTVREAMELQTIPKEYTFLPNATEKEMREMIGEAVPSQLAKAITEHIIKMDK